MIKLRQKNERSTKMPSLPRAISDKILVCPACEEEIPAGEILAIYNGKGYCECCVEDYEEEGRPM